MDMRRALKDKLAGYKIPQEMRVVKDGLPRNAMGKGKSCIFLCLVLLLPMPNCPKNLLIYPQF